MAKISENSSGSIDIFHRRLDENRRVIRVQARTQSGDPIMYL
jgi:hypothetical protein